MASCVFVEYMWLCADGSMASKTRILDVVPKDISDVPVIVSQQDDENGDVYLQPRSLFTDPFRGEQHLLVLCDSFSTEIAATDSRTVCIRPLGARAACADVMQKADAMGSNSLFGCEQQYYSGYWPHENIPNPANHLLEPSNHAPGDSTALKLRYKSRRLAERHLRTCLSAGIEVVEASEVHPSPSTLPADNAGSCWSYKINSSKGLHLADQLWMSRFLMIRLSDEEGVPISFTPPSPGQPNLARCFIECSNQGTRNPQCGLSTIQLELERLGSSHEVHLMAYEKVLKGFQGASGNFVVNAPGDKRHSSVYVPKTTLVHNSGYYIDCRPCSDIDPYLAIMMLASTTLLIPLPAPGELASFQDPKHSNVSPRGEAELEETLTDPQGLEEEVHRSLSRSSLGYGSRTGITSVSLLIQELNRMDSNESSESHVNPYHDQDDLMMLYSIDDDFSDDFDLSDSGSSGF